MQYFTFSYKDEISNNNNNNEIYILNIWCGEMNNVTPKFGVALFTLH